MALAAFGSAALAMLGNAAVRGLRMYFARYRLQHAPIAAAEVRDVAKEVGELAETEFQANIEFRKDVIDKAKEGYEAISTDLADEIKDLEPGSGSLERKHMDQVLEAVNQETCLVTDGPSSARTVRLYYSAIRGSRTNPVTNALGKMFMIASHWCVEVDGIFYELRDRPPSGGREMHHRGDLIHREFGSKIRLDITTNREPTPGAECIDIGTTEMSNGQIIRLATFVFRRFSSEFNLFVNNCQLFSQLLCEVLVGKDNAMEVSRRMRKKSIILLPVIATVAGAPLYWTTAEIHYILARSPLKEAKLTEIISECLKIVDQLQFHPRIYRYRQDLLPL